MIKSDPSYVPNAAYTQEDWDEVSDNPPLTPEELANAKPLNEVLQNLANTMRKARGLQRTPTKTMISLRVDQRVLDHFRATGPGWQSRMNAVLLRASGLD